MKNKQDEIGYKFVSRNKNIIYKKASRILNVSKIRPINFRLSELISEKVIAVTYYVYNEKKAP